MADLSQTRVNVAIGGTGFYQPVQVGEAILHGQPLYQDVTTGKFFKAAKTSQALAKCVAISLTPASTDGWILVVRGDGMLINLGATLVVGKTYVVSGSGAISPIDDLVSTNWKSTLGTAITTSLLKTKFDITDVQIA